MEIKIGSMTYRLGLLPPSALFIPGLINLNSVNGPFLAGTGGPVQGPQSHLNWE